MAKIAYKLPQIWVIFVSQRIWICLPSSSTLVKRKCPLHSCWRGWEIDCNPWLAMMRFGYNQCLFILVSQCKKILWTIFCLDLNVFIIWVIWWISHHFVSPILYFTLYVFYFQPPEPIKISNLPEDKVCMSMCYKTV